MSSSSRSYHHTCGVADALSDRLVTTGDPPPGDRSRPSRITVVPHDTPDVADDGTRHPPRNHDERSSHRFRADHDTPGGVPVGSALPRPLPCGNHVGAVFAYIPVGGTNSVHHAPRNRELVVHSMRVTTCALGAGWVVAAILFAILWMRPGPQAPAPQPAASAPTSPEVSGEAPIVRTAAPRTGADARHPESPPPGTSDEE